MPARDTDECCHQKLDPDRKLPDLVDSRHCHGSVALGSTPCREPGSPVQTADDQPTDWAGRCHRRTDTTKLIPLPLGASQPDCRTSFSPIGLSPNNYRHLKSRQQRLHRPNHFSRLRPPPRRQREQEKQICFRTRRSSIRHHIATINRCQSTHANPALNVSIRKPMTAVD